MTPNEVFFESLMIGALNVFAVYLAAFVYKMNWMGVMMVMVVASLLSGLIVHIFADPMFKLAHSARNLLSEAVGTLTIAGISGLIVLLMLTRRFNFPEALGISLLAGGVSAFTRAVLKDM